VHVKSIRFLTPIPAATTTTAVAAAATDRLGMCYALLFWAYQNVYERVKSATISRVFGNAWRVKAECF
jgi:hypothetical protein